MEARSHGEQHNAGPTRKTSQPAGRERAWHHISYIVQQFQTGITFYGVITDQISQLNPKDHSMDHMSRAVRRWLWGAFVIILLLPENSSATINKPPQIMKDLNQKMPLKVGSFNRSVSPLLSNKILSVLARFVRQDKNKPVCLLSRWVHVDNLFVCLSSVVLSSPDYWHYLPFPQPTNYSST